MVNKFKKRDKVKVICGKDKGKVAELIRCFPKHDKVVLDGVNLVKRHTKPTKANPEGGILKKEMPIHISNIMHIDPKTNIVTRVGSKKVKGNNVRYYKKSGKIVVDEGRE